MTNRFRAEQVGSLLRPPELLAARSAHAAGQITIEELRAQRRPGHPGRARETASHRAGCSFGRRDAARLLAHRHGRRGRGFVPDKVTLEWKGPGGGAEGSTAQVAGAKLRKLRKLTGHELPLLKQAAEGPFKITLPAPSNFVSGQLQARRDRRLLSHACRSAEGPGGHRSRRSALAGVGRRALHPVRRAVLFALSGSSAARANARGWFRPRIRNWTAPSPATTPRCTKFHAAR